MNPRIRNLPCSEQQPFKNWLAHWFKSRPIDNPNLPNSEWDWYFEDDYKCWKNKPVNELTRDERPA